MTAFFIVMSFIIATAEKSNSSLNMMPTHIMKEKPE
jgi:hypothetical protein